MISNFTSNEFNPLNLDDVLDNEFNQTKIKPDETIIHLRLTSRSKDKYITTIEGLPENFNFKLFLKEMKKKLSCNGCIKNDEKTECNVVQLTGDHRDFVESFLIKEQITNKDNIKMHGF